MLILMPILADILGGWEILLILSLILILFGARHLPGMARGFGDGIFRFRKAFDQEANEAGESLGGIYGKPAVEALTPDNRTNELYDPAVFYRDKRNRRATKRMRFRRWLRFWQSIWHAVLKCLKLTLPKSTGNSKSQQ